VYALSVILDPMTIHSTLASSSRNYFTTFFTPFPFPWFTSSTAPCVMFSLFVSVSNCCIQQILNILPLNRLQDYNANHRWNLNLSGGPIGLLVTIVFNWVPAALLIFYLICRKFVLLDAYPNSQPTIATVEIGAAIGIVEIICILLLILN
jgi:hypothetical protein